MSGTSFFTQAHSDNLLFESWTSYCDSSRELHEEMCSLMYNVNIYVVMLAMLIIGMIFLISYKRIVSALYAAVPALWFFMVHSMLNTLCVIAHVIIYREAILMKFSNNNDFDGVSVNSIMGKKKKEFLVQYFFKYVKATDMGIFLLQLAMILTLACMWISYYCNHRISPGSLFMTFLASIISSALFYDHTVRFFSLFVEEDYHYLLKILALASVPCFWFIIWLITTILHAVFEKSEEEPKKDN